MIQTGQELLTTLLAQHLNAVMEGAGPGHCVRVDDVNNDLAPHLARALADGMATVRVHVLRKDPSETWDISADRAIEIRNRKQSACLLVVPAGEGHAASSLDNSFRRIPVLDVYKQIERRLIDDIDDSIVRELAARNRRWLRGQRQEAWAEFLAHLCAEPTEAAFGRNLWRVGLVPDHGPNPGERIERNRLAVQAISRPSRPAAAMDERFTLAGVQEGSWRGTLRRFCEQRGAQLANPRLWTGDIATGYPELTFDRWPLVESIAEDIDGLEVVPFTNGAGKVEAWSKLRQGEDGQLVLQVPENGTGTVTVKWKTTPPNVAAVHKWELSVVPPDDMRTDDTEALAVALVQGAKRQGTLKVALEDDSLAAGTRFVVSVRAIGEHGEWVDLRSGEPASADSQEFQIVGTDEVEAKTRRAAAASVPEAVLRAAVDGLDDLTEDLVSWDPSGQVFSLRLGNRRSVQVRICEPLIHLQRRATRNPEQALHFSARASYGSPLDLDRVASEELQLPNALLKARAKFLTALSAVPHRDTVESALWTEELRELAGAYAASYKRALEAGGPNSADLLRLDTFSLAVRRSNRVINAVVALPTHPLRALWAALHDQTLRAWADQVTEVELRGSRSRMVDVALVGQVVPANLPFTVPAPGGELAVYVEELTYASGLFIVPTDIDSEAAAESVTSVLELPRTGSAMRASSDMVAERVAAYVAAHNSGATLRVLAINPGSGDLVAGALAEPPAADDDESPEPRRLEVLAYSDSPAYVRPVPGLISLQGGLRGRELANGSTHLTPPLSLSVRSVSELKADARPAHLAIVQDIGSPLTTVGTDPGRRPAFQDLLVPIVTTASVIDGDLVWDSAPATGPGSGGSDTDLHVVHRTHQRAVARDHLSSGDLVPVVRVVLDGERQSRIAAAHARADWVIGIDRYIGVDLFETGAAGAIGESYILDYAPDFVEGIGERLTVTTANHREVEQLLEVAMTELGLAEVEHSVRDVLSSLTVVSGRLALRLLKDSNHAREAVALAAVIAHLRGKGDLEGLIVVPVDAHPEIFGVAARDEGAARRCDLLLIRVGQRSFKIECVEVKSRKEARVPQMLADHIVDQLQDTKRVLESRFFASDPPRIDADLQLARLASVLHHYADRSVSHGIIDAAKVSDVHRHIDRVIENRIPAEISMRGYVISLDGDEGFKKKYGEVPLTVLTANDLGALGFSTVLPHDGASGHDIVPEPEPEPEPEPGPESGLHGRQQPRERKVDHLSPEDVDLPVEPMATPASPLGEPGSEAGKPDGNDSAAGRSGERHDHPAEPSQVDVVLGTDSSSSEVLWPVSTQGSPHAFIVGIPGQGKSVTTRHVIRSFADQGLPSLVFDFHGDMAADPPEGAAVLNAAEGLPFSPFEAEVRVGRPINTTAWEISEIVAHVTGLGEIQRNHVYDALQAMYASHGWRGTEQGSSIPVISEFGPAIDVAEESARGKNARQRLRPMTDFGLFRDDADQSFDLLGTYQGGVVVDVSQLGLEEVQMFAASFLLRKVYREMFKWRQDHTLKLAVVLDEAHRMAKDVTLPKLMKEGRKYGLSVIVASQNAKDFHKDVLGNAGTKIVFRTNHPESRAVAGYLRGRSGLDLSLEIERLNVGVAFVSTPSNPQARRVYMNGS